MSGVFFGNSSLMFTSLVSVVDVEKLIAPCERLLKLNP